MGMEDYIIILDYSPLGLPEDERPLYMREPVAYAVGEKFFTLMLVVPKQGIELKPHERVYIGKDSREKIEYIKKRADYSELSAAAKSELPFAIEKIIQQDEKRFVQFFNEAQPLTTRLHSLELLPGIGKKLMWHILEERKKKPFESFADIAARIKTLPDPKKLIVRRIVLELEEEEAKTGKIKHRLFVQPFPPRK